MLTLYKNEKYIKNPERLVYFVDLYFNDIVDKIEINEIDKGYMKAIDKADYLGKKEFISPFGRSNITDLSTGCKALILLKHSEELGDLIVNISECGGNALDRVFQMDNKKVLLLFFSMPNSFDEIKDIQIKLVGRKERVMTLEELYSRDWSI